MNVVKFVRLHADGRENPTCRPRKWESGRPPSPPRAASGCLDDGTGSGMWNPAALCFWKTPGEGDTGVE